MRGKIKLILLALLLLPLTKGIDVSAEESVDICIHYQGPCTDVNGNGNEYYDYSDEYVVVVQANPDGTFTSPDLPDCPGMQFSHYETNSYDRVYDDTVFTEDTCLWAVYDYIQVPLVDNLLVLADWEYTVDSTNKIITLTKYIGESNDVTVYGAYQLSESDSTLYQTKIGLGYSGALADARPRLTSVTFTKVGNHYVQSDGSWSWTFSGASNLTYADISGLAGNNQTDINRMFNSCTNLIEVDITGVFEGITNSVDCCNFFYDCNKLTTINGFECFPAKATTLSCFLFHCHSLTSSIPTDIPATVTNMYQFASEARSLPDQALPDISKCTNLRDISCAFYEWRNCTYDITNYVIPDGVTHMFGAFFWDYNLTGGVPRIPESVINMEYAFRNCAKLTGTITNIPTGIVSMQQAFANCGKLTGTIPMTGIYTKIETMHEAFKACSSLTGSTPDLSQCTKLTNLSETFNGCTGLNGTIGALPNSLQKLTWTFRGCSNLNGNIPDLSQCTNLTEMPYAFYNCSNLTGGTPDLSHTTVTDMTHSFSGCSSLNGTIGELPNSVTTLYSTFYNCSKLIGSTPDLSDCANLTDMSWAFSGCSSLDGTIGDISSSIVDMRYAFCDCSSLTGSTPDLSSCSALTNMKYTFGRCSSLGGTIGSLPSSITTLASTFIGCNNLTGPIPSFEGLVNLETMTQAFYNCSSLTGSTPDLSSCVKLTNMQETFRGCTGLTAVGSLPANVSNLVWTFYNCSRLTGEVVFPVFTSANVDMSRAFYCCDNLTSFVFPDQTAEFTLSNTFYATKWVDTNVECDIASSLNQYNWEGDNRGAKLVEVWWPIGSPNLNDVRVALYNDGELAFVGTGDTIVFESNGDLPWHTYCDDVLSYSIEQTVQPRHMDYWLSYCKNLTGNIHSIPLSVESMNGTFEYSTGLIGSIPDLSRHTNLKSLVYTFAGCTGLDGTIGALPTSIVDIESMCDSCAGLTGTVPDLSSCVLLENMCGTFYKCSGLTGSTPDLSACTSLTDMSWAFSFCTDLNGTIGALPTSVQNLYYTFDECSNLTGGIPDLSGCVELVDMNSTFYECSKLTGPIPDISQCTKLVDAAFAFTRCAGLTGPLPDLSNCTLLTSLESTFDGCIGLTGNIFNFSRLVNLENMEYTFNSCTGLTGSTPDLSKCTKLTTMARAYANCSGLDGNIGALPPNIEEMWYTFFNCSNLTGGFPDMSECTNLFDIYYAFSGCSGLNGRISSLPDGLIYANSAFAGCVGLECGGLLDLSNCTKLEDMHYMFVNCTGLTGGVWLPVFEEDYSDRGYIDMIYMFAGCPNLTFFILPDQNIPVGNTGSVFPVVGDNIETHVYCSETSSFRTNYTWEAMDKRTVEFRVIDELWKIGSPIESDVLAILCEDGLLAFEGVGDTEVYDTFHEWSGSSEQVTAYEINELVQPKNMNSWFSQCINLTGEIHDIPSSVQSLSSTFSGCYNLTGSVPDLDYCTKLRDISVAFNGCTGLNGTIGKMPTSLENAHWTFYRCESLTGSSPDLSKCVNLTDMSYMYWGCTNMTGTIGAMPPNVVDVRSAFQQSGFTGSTPDMSMCKNIEEMQYTFLGCANLDGTIGNLPPNVAALYATFRGCTSLTGDIPDMSNCTKLASLSSTFEGCSGLDGVIQGLPASLKSASYPFSGCVNLHGTLTLPVFTSDSVDLIFAFQGLDKITEVIIPKQTSNIFMYYTFATTSTDGVNFERAPLTLSVDESNRNLVETAYPIFSGRYTFEEELPMVTQNLYATQELELMPILSESTYNLAHMSYQWYRCDDVDKTNPVAIDGATDEIYSVDSASMSDSGYYYCVACDGITTVEATPVMVNVMSKDVSFIITLPQNVPLTEEAGVSSGDFDITIKAVAMPLENQYISVNWTAPSNYTEVIDGVDYRTWVPEVIDTGSHSYGNSSGILSDSGITVTDTIDVQGLPAGAWEGVMNFSIVVQE